MPLQQIRPDFSGSAQSMHQAMQGANQLGDYANQLIKDVRQKEQDATEEARYQTELARQKVLDDRATVVYEQQQRDRSNKELMQGSLGKISLEELEKFEADEAAAAALNEAALKKAAAVPPQGANINQDNNAVVGTQGYYKTEQSPGKYSNPNPTIAFNRGQTVSKENKLPGESKLSQVIDGMAPLSGIGNIAKVVNAFLPDAAKNKLLETPGMYTSIPGSSVRVLNAAGKEALLKGSYTTTERKVAPTTTTLNDIDLTKVYNAQGKALSAKDAGDGSKVYYRTKVDGAFVNAMDVYKGAAAKEASYVQGKSERTYVPGTKKHTEYVSGTSNKEFIGSNGTTVPVKDVVGSVQSAVGSYQDAVDKLANGNTTAKQMTTLTNRITKRVLKEHPDLAYMVLDIQEMAKKSVGLQLPDGSFTDAEKLKLTAAGEDLKQLHSVQKEQRGYDNARENLLLGFQHSERLSDKQIAAARENSVRSVRATRDPVQEAIDKEMAMRRIEKMLPKQLTPQESIKYQTDKFNLEQLKRDQAAGNDWNPFT